MVKTYVPDYGDIVYMNFNPQAGREQGGKRPGLILSPHTYNSKTGLALVVPVTTKKKGYAFEVLLHENLKTDGVILADQIRSLDWQHRKISFVEKCDIETIQYVVDLLQHLME